MAWGEVKVMDQRKKFIDEVMIKKNSISELSRQYEISRKTAYKWINRFNQIGLEGLKDLSKAPHNHGRLIDKDKTEKIILMRHKYPTWGPRKILAWLKNNFPKIDWPPASTIGNIFDRYGLTIPRQKRSKCPKTHPLQNCNNINDTWCADFKGWFLTGDKSRCDPLTITDAHSRYLIRCNILANLNDINLVWPVFDAAFREYGLPLRIRMDNGWPFATTGAGRLSPLSVNFIKAGVLPEWIKPGKPYENGRHERFHLTLKKDVLSPPAQTIYGQSRLFHKFRKLYNNERPHEALNNKTPAECYEPSPRRWSGKLKPPEYPETYRKRKVKLNGSICLEGKYVYIAKSLNGEYVGLEEKEEGQDVYYGPLCLGKIKENSLIKPK